MTEMNIVGFIFARGGSKGLPGKNIRLLAGKPLIAWSIEHAKAVSRINRVIVSTDCPKIAAVALEYGAEVPFMRPADLASDFSPEWLAWQHALRFLVDEKGLPDVMLSIPATAPLRLASDIDKCIDLFMNNNSETVITCTQSHRNPWFNMLKVNCDGYVSLVNEPDTPISRRQDAPPVYDMSTVAYVTRPAFVLTHNSVFEGRVQAVKIPIERAVDIDSLFDFELAELLIHRRKFPSVNI
jgi:CMP-N-acetylneuraminic acid synthetase